MADNYLLRTAQEPHRARRDKILRKYPSVRKLMGHYRWSALLIVFIGATQIGIAEHAGKHFSFLGILALSLLVGAVAHHALFVLIHEATHNLIFKGTTANRWIGIIANLPQGLPSAMAFRSYHLLHHRHQGLLDYDADLPGPVEAKFIGRSAIGKALWLFSFLIIQGFVRPARLKRVKLWNGWVVMNLLIQLAFNTVIISTMGWMSLFYLGLSTWFAVGLHPLGARWVQEHFVFREGQETYSYYGPWNWLMFNVGHHNEHHDLMNVPWTRLPELRRTAPEFYDELHAHHSYWRLLNQFLFDPKVSAYSRVIQIASEPGHAVEGSSAPLEATS